MLPSLKDPGLLPPLSLLVTETNSLPRAVTMPTSSPEAPEQQG